MDLYEVADELKKIAEKSPRLDVAVAFAPRLLAEPRYKGAGGADVLVQEIATAITHLPEERSLHAKILLKLEAKQDSTWSHRIAEIDPGGNGRGKPIYATLILTCVAYELCQLWNRDDTPTKRHIFEPFERISYEIGLEMDPEDHRKFTEHRDIHLRAAAPAQRLITLPYYYLAPCAKPKVEPLTPGFDYVTSIPNPESRWGTHILNLLRRYEIGEPVRIKTRETFQDTKRRLMSLNPRHGLHQLVAVASPDMSFIHIAVRLPPTLARRAKPEAKIVTQDPFNQEVRTWHPEVDGDGWVNARFDQDLEQGCKCVVRFPGLDPYS